MGIKAKILTPAVIVILFVASAILVSNIMLFSGFVDASTVEVVDHATKVALNSIESLKSQAKSASAGLARDPEIIAALADDNREALMARAQNLQEESGIEFCTVADAQGRVLARTHEPASYGDSVMYQANVRSAVAGLTLAALEKGSVVRLAVRAGAPVFDAGGALVGIVSVGYRLDTEGFVAAHKEMTGCEFTIVMDGERVASTMLMEDGGSVVGTRADQLIVETVAAGRAYSGQVDIMGRAAVARYIPLEDPDGRVIGMIFSGQYLEKETDTIMAFVREGALITALMLAVAIGVIFLIVERIVRPLRAMTRAAVALAAGDTDLDLTVKTRDETRLLADAFNRMIENTRRQVKIIEHIAAGDLALAPEPRSEKDLMGRALEKLNATIKEQAAAIREEHDRVRIMLDATPLASRLWSPDFKLIDCNEAAVKLFGLKSKQEYMGRYFELSPECQPDGRPTADKGLAAVREAYDKGHFTCEWTYQMPDGEPLPCELTMVRVPYGKDYAVAAYSRDLREQRKMMREMEQRDALLQTVNQAAEIILRSEPDDFARNLHRCMGMMTEAIEADRMYIWKNHAESGKLLCTQIYEWSERVRPFQGSELTRNLSYDEKVPEFKEIYLRGQCLNMLVRDVPQAARPIFEAKGILSILAVPIFIRNEFWGFVGFDDCRRERLFTENEVSVMHSGSLLIANAVWRNEHVLELRDTSARLQDALRSAKEASHAKSAFLAQMSHEIRTPLNAVVGLSELALGYGGLEDETRDRLEKIHNSGLTILSIVNDILDISKIESGKFELFNAEYDTPSLINDVVALNVVRIGEKPLAFKLDVDENLPATLYGDDLRVKQVFNNLLSNAFKYTNAGEVEWRLRHERDAEGVWLLSSIRDTGIGIRPDDLRRIFSDYNQVDMETNRRVEGTGLGLAISGRLVDMMGGRIEVESEYGRGTTFRLRLRQGLASDAPIGREVAENLMGLRHTLSRRSGHKQMARLDLSYAHVLLVDDIATNLDVAKGMMKPYGMKIDCAASGLQAIELIRGERPRYGAVFMDHMMPIMDGLEATRIIREDIGTDYARNVPIIALTANAIVGNEEMFLNNGFQDFISKPIDMAKLDAVLRRWVRDKNLEKEFLEKAEFTPGEAGGSGLLPEGRAIGGLDKAAALRRFNGDEAVLISVMRSYSAGTRALLKSLGEYLEAGKLADYAIAVHGIKGASYGLAAAETGRLAEEQEKAARAGNLTAVRAGHGMFAETTERLLAAIDGALAAVDAAADKPLAAAPDPELLRELREACAAFDMDRVDAAMAGLEAFRYENGEELLAWLREQVDNMAFEEIFNIGLLELQQRAAAAGDRPRPAPAGFTAPEAEILIVDDNETNLAAALGLLKPLQMRLETAAGGRQALSMIGEKRYHLILMDQLMPEMDGLETVRRLREMEGERFRQVPVIALTADESPGARENCLRAGMNDFMAKPLDMEEARAKIRRWLPKELLREQPPPGGPEAPRPSPGLAAGLPRIEGVDSGAGVRHSGSKELFRQLLGNFYKLISLKAAKMESCLADGRLQDLTTEVHAMKNNARMIGAGELAEAFGRLEAWGREGNWEALRLEAPAVLARYRAFKPLLAAFGAAAEGEKREASGEELLSLLRWLKLAARSFDLDGADAALRQLEELRLPDGCLEHMETLRAHVADVATEEMADLAELMMKMIESDALGGRSSASETERSDLF